MSQTKLPNLYPGSYSFTIGGKVCSHISIQSFAAWTLAIFLRGGPTSWCGYTDESYELSKKPFLLKRADRYYDIFKSNFVKDLANR